MIVDLYLAYSFIRRIATPFSSWPAYTTGVIDDAGNILVKKKDRTKEQKSSFGIFDLMILKLKKLLSTVPGGSSRIASYIAALWLIKEWNHFSEESMLTEEVSEDILDSSLDSFLEMYFHYTNTVDFVNENVNEDGIAGGSPTVSAGSGAIAGLGVGPQGEPGLTRRQQKTHRARAAATVPDQITRRKSFKTFMGEADVEADTLAAVPTGKSQSRFRRDNKHPRPTEKLT